MSRKTLVFILLFGFHQFNPSAFAAQHALVVGINEYPQEGNISLKGAVNDALLLEKALRRIHVQLPKKRVLLNEQATYSNVIRAWHDMVAEANPGDTLIFTYAGHGGQKKDAPPLDEKDNSDETLILYQGEIIDDELTDLFATASQYKILFVADSCHSGGLIRSAGKGFCRSRFARRSTSNPRQHPRRRIDSNGDEKERLPHVTFITAVDVDSLTVCESEFEGEAHGALSWFFAKALAGDADGNQNKRLERYELDDYLPVKIRKASGGKQTPKILPRTNSQQVVILLQGEGISTPIPPTVSNLPQNKIKIKIINGNAPGRLRYIQRVEQGFDLLFVKNGGFTEVYNKIGDKMTTVSSQQVNKWQSLINKERLLQVLSTQFDMRLKPIQIKLWEGNKLHKRGERLNFHIIHTDSGTRLNALTLFNLAGDGELQFLYPLKRRKHSPTIQQFPYFLPPIGVAPPFGGDTLVAILCTHPPTRLQQLLANKAPFIPEPAQIISALHDQRCQVGEKAFFTGE